MDWRQTTGYDAVGAYLLAKDISARITCGFAQQQSSRFTLVIVNQGQDWVWGVFCSPSASETPEICSLISVDVM